MTRQPVRPPNQLLTGAGRHGRKPPLDSKARLARAYHRAPPEVVPTRQTDDSTASPDGLTPTQQRGQDGGGAGSGGRGLLLWCYRLPFKYSFLLYAIYLWVIARPEANYRRGSC